MSGIVFLISLVFVLLGSVLLWNGRDPWMAWMGVIFFGGCGLVALWDMVGPRIRASKRLDDDLDRIVVRGSKIHFFVYLVGGAAFAFAGFVMIGRGKPFIGWFTVAFFGLGSILFLWQIVDPRPRLVIDEH
jgi:hypothetical protein